MILLLFAERTDFSNRETLHAFSEIVVSNYLKQKKVSISNYKHGLSSVNGLTFVRKVTENLCSGWVFFQANLDFLTSHFWPNVSSYFSKSISALSLNLKIHFTCDLYL